MHTIILSLILNDILLTISEPQPGRHLPCRLLPDPGPPQSLTATVHVCEAPASSPATALVLTSLATGHTGGGIVGQFPCLQHPNLHCH